MSSLYTFIYCSYPLSQASASSGVKVAVSIEAAMRRRMAAISSTMPAALACSMMLPIAVHSLGPATTGTPTALQVNWLRRLLREPPPITCSASMGNGAICCR